MMGYHPTEMEKRSGIQIVPGRASELLRVMRDVSDTDVGALDPSLGAWARRPLGREALAAVLLQVSGSAWVGLLNIEPAGFIAIERRATSARVRALAVAPDLRRRGCARALLVETVARAADQKLGWVWMDIPADNTAGIQCALSSGFRRLLPQYLRRAAAGLIPASAHRIRLTPAQGKAAAAAIYEAAGSEADAGDAWAAGYARMEHPGLPDPAAGLTLMAEVEGRAAGCAHLQVDGDKTRVWLWLSPEIWADDLEFAILRATLNTLQRAPSVIEVRLGSGDHLRAAAQRFKAAHFELAREPIARFVRATG